MHTTSCWFTIPRAVMTSRPYGGDDRRDGVIGLAFAMRQVAQLLSIGVSTVWRDSRAGVLPKPIKLSRGSTRWVASELEAYAQARIAESRGEKREAA